jgi:DNA-binding LytR/AlgR family response regulator
VKLRCVTVDDEPLAHDVLGTYIARLPHLTHAARCMDAMEALEWLHRGAVDLLFLDIDMPELDGLALLRVLPAPLPVVLTTAHAGHALESYEYGVVDYLLKPIAFERFVKAVNRAPQRRPDAVGAPERPEWQLLEEDGVIHRVALADIRYLQANGNYVSVVLAHRSLLVQDTLKNMLQRLPPERFVQVHRSYVVNLAHVTSIEADRVALVSGEVPLGQTYRRVFLQRFRGEK